MAQARQAGDPRPGPARGACQPGPRGSAWLDSEPSAMRGAGISLTACREHLSLSLSFSLSLSLSLSLPLSLSHFPPPPSLSLGSACELRAQVSPGMRPGMRSAPSARAGLRGVGHGVAVTALATNHTAVGGAPPCPSWLFSGGVRTPAPRGPAGIAGICAGRAGGTGGPLWAAEGPRPPLVLRTLAGKYCGPLRTSIADPCVLVLRTLACLAVPCVQACQCAPRCPGPPGKEQDGWARGGPGGQVGQSRRRDAAVSGPSRVPEGRDRHGLGRDVTGKDSGGT